MDSFIFRIDSKISPGKKVVGGKGNSLIKIKAAGFNVPDGFIIGAGAFRLFINYNGMAKRFNRLNKRYITNSSKQNLEEELVRGTKVPEKVCSHIADALNSTGLAGKRLVVRSSAGIEDSALGSFAGQFKSVINVKGVDDVIDAVKTVYLSTFDPNVAEYCKLKGIDFDGLDMAVIVQELVVGEVSGVMFSSDPLGRQNNILIEAVVGLNEGLVSGIANPTKFVVSPDCTRIITKSVREQARASRLGGTGTKVAKNNERVSAILDEKQILPLSRLGAKLQLLFGAPQDIEWTSRNGEVYVLQSRPITTGNTNASATTIPAGFETVLTGYPAATGSASGTITVIKGKRAPRPGIFVFTYTTTDQMPIIRKAKAIITEDGGTLSHSAIVARELGIPCIVGVDNVTKLLQNGDSAFVDATSGKLYIRRRINLAERRVSDAYDESLFWCLEDMHEFMVGEYVAFYELWGNKIVCYARKEAPKHRLKGYLTRRFGGKRDVVFGDPIKCAIKSGVIKYSRDKEVAELYRRCISNVEELSAEKLKAAVDRAIKFAERQVSIAASLRRANSFDDRLARFKALIKALSAYTLLNVLICEGYGPRTLYSATLGLRGKMGLGFPSFVEFLDAKTSPLATFELKSHDEALIRRCMEYYDVLKYWRQESYPLFVTIGAEGDKFWENLSAEIEILNILSNEKLDRKGWDTVAFVTVA